MPGEFDWPAALDAANLGTNLAGIGRVREFMTAVGVPQPPLHELEKVEIKRLRDAAARNIAAAEEIEARAS